MSKRFLWLVFFFVFSCLFADEGQFYLEGYLKELKYQAGFASGKEHLLEMINSLPEKNISFRQAQWLNRELTEIALNYQQKGDLTTAEKIMEKIVKADWGDWKSISFYHEIKKQNSGAFVLDPWFRQLKKILTDFNSSLFLVNRLIYYAFLALMIATLFYVFFFFLNYFEIIINDCLLNDQRQFIFRKLIIALALLFWPVILFSWGFFPFLIAPFCWYYFEKRNRKNLLFLFGGLLILSLLMSFKLYIEKAYSSPEFKKAENIFYAKKMAISDYRDLDSELQIYQAYNYIAERNYQRAEEILSQSKMNSLLAKKLKGILALEYREYDRSISYFRDLLQAGERDYSTLNNLTLALVRKGEMDVYNSFANAYEEIKTLKNNVFDIVLPSRDSSFLFKRLFYLGKEKPHLLEMLKVIGFSFLRVPVYLGILIFLFYLKIIKKLFGGIGRSIFCSKCHKIIKRPPIERPNLMCDDCYQLFLIKDPIFFDAKILKEKELQKSAGRKKNVFLILGIVIPGIALLYKKNYGLFSVLYAKFAFFSLLALSAANDFYRHFQAVPLLLPLSGILAVLAYLILNISAIWVENDAA